MRDHMRRILVGQSKLFSFGSDNAVLQLVSRGGPRVLESQARLLPSSLLPVPAEVGRCAISCSGARIGARTQLGLCHTMFNIPCVSVKA